MAEVVPQINGSHSVSDNLETFSLIWLDDSTKSSNEDEHLEQDLRNIINHLIKFKNEQTCQQYIEEQSEEDKLILIVNDLSGHTLVPRIHQLRQVYSIYVYCKNNMIDQEWITKFAKVKLPKWVLQ